MELHGYVYGGHLKTRYQVANPHIVCIYIYLKISQPVLRGTQWWASSNGSTPVISSDSDFEFDDPRIQSDDQDDDNKELGGPGGGFVIGNTSTRPTSAQEFVMVSWLPNRSSVVLAVREV